MPSPPLQRDAPSIALRPWGSERGDAEALASAWADEAIGRWTAVPAARSSGDAARWIAGEGRRRDDGLALDLVITPSGDPATLMGEVGLVVVEPDRRWAEVGYWLLPRWRGAGRASAAVGLFSEWALRVLPVAKMFARTAAANPGSAAVAERAGYRRAGELADGGLVWVRDGVAPGEVDAAGGDDRSPR